MKNIFFEIKEHLKADFNSKTYIFILIFTFLSLFLSYSFNLNNNLLFRNFGSLQGLFQILFFYILLYVTILLIILITKNKLYLFKSKELFIKIFAFIATFGFLSGLYYTDFLAINLGANNYEKYYLAMIFVFTKQIVPYLIVLYIIKKIFDKNDNHIYGLRIRGLDLRPYFIFLLLLIPLVVFASFFSDFLTFYPRFKYWEYPKMFGLNSFEQSFFFESAYIINFISTEIFFRGALVIALANVLGKESVLAMASFYCFTHFGKPIGEAITSFFGGYILGVIALNHKNITGGIIVHVGLALMMEIISIFQYFLR